MSSPVTTRGPDPRAQLAALVALLIATLFGGWPGLTVGAAAAALSIAVRPGRGGALRTLAAVAPLALAVGALDALAGRPAEGVAAGLRLVIVTAIAISFARGTDPRAMATGLRALRVPYPFVFVLVTGARFIPVAGSDLGELTDAARLRGITVSGPAWRRISDWLILLVPLLVLTIRRGLQLGDAMEARGFSDGGRSTSLTALSWHTRDTAIVGLAAAALALVLTLSHTIAP